MIESGKISSMPNLPTLPHKPPEENLLCNYIPITTTHGEESEDGVEVLAIAAFPKNIDIMVSPAVRG